MESGLSHPPLPLTFNGGFEMEFNLEKFTQSIQTFKVKKMKEMKDESGLVNVMRHILDHDSINNINFSNFTLDDVEEAYRLMEDIDFGPIEDDEGPLFLNPSSPYLIYHQVDTAVFQLSISKDKHFPIEDEEDFFI